MIYSSKEAWEGIRSRDMEIAWVNVVWSANCIPRHAFHLWLIFRRRLVTQDRMHRWNTKKGNMNMMCCLLCHSDIECHNHLFFACKFAEQVWFSIRHKAGMKDIHNSWDDIVGWLVPRAKSNSIRSVIGRLLVAATAYFIWQERNTRFFSNHSRPPDQLTEVILATVRMKLKTLRFKKKAHVTKLLEEWDIVTTCTFTDD